MIIGIIGAGKIGGTLARLWANAGHEVILTSRHPDRLEKLRDEIGSGARVGPPEEAARAGDVILLSIPLGEIPNLSETTLNLLCGKIVMNAANPYVDRDGEFACEVFNEGAGTGVWSMRYLPGARVVRAFNTVRHSQLDSEAHRAGDPLGVPLASDEEEALRIVSRLVRDAGFGPVVVGPLKRAKEFDPDTPPYASGASAGELEVMFHLTKAA